MEIKGRPISITGRTEINNQIRHNLNLNFFEYAILDALEKINIEINDPVMIDLYKKLGIRLHQCKPTIDRLIKKGFITVEENHYTVSDKWKNAFGFSMNEFEEFWTVMVDGKKKTAWPGAKKEALAKYKKARKLYSREYLLAQRNNYFEFMRHPRNEYRQQLQASVFLGLEKEKFKSDWKEMLNALGPGNEEADTKASKMTKKDIDELWNT